MNYNQNNDSKICPLHSIQCMGERCAMFSSAAGDCAFAAIADELVSVSYELRRMNIDRPEL